MFPARTALPDLALHTSGADALPIPALQELRSRGRCLGGADEIDVEPCPLVLAAALVPCFQPRDLAGPEGVLACVVELVAKLREGCVQVDVRLLIDFGEAIQPVEIVARLVSVLFV